MRNRGTATPVVPLVTICPSWIIVTMPLPSAIAQRLLIVSGLLLGVVPAMHGQLGLGIPSQPAPNSSTLLSDPAMTPGLRFLYDLEAQFARATAEGGGKAFASWFASDAVSIANGKPPVQGHDAIAAQATWLPGAYQLTWTPDGGQMGPSGDMGYTWGHYSGHAKDAAGNDITTTGRYITMWKKQTDGTWKVVLDASNEGPALECCKLP